MDTSAASTLANLLVGFAIRVRRAVTAIAVVAAVGGLTACVLGIAAWHDSTPAVVLVVLIGVAAVAAPLLVAYRARPIATAVAKPTETATEAKAYFSSLPASFDLEALAQRVQSVRQTQGSRRLWTLAQGVRQVTDLTGRVAPDPKVQPLLGAFTPARLRGLWWASLASLWLWFISMLIAGLALLTLLVGSIT